MKPSHCSPYKPLLSAKDKKVLRATAKKFLDLMRERVAVYLWLEDVDALDRLVSQMEMLGSFELVKVLRDKGFSKEITELCDKAGMIK